MTREVLVFARDAVSGVSPSPITPACVASSWSDDDEDKGSDDHKSVKLVSNSNRDDNGSDDHRAELCTYRITDAAGSTLTLVEKVKQESGDDNDRKEVKVKVVSTQYNSGPVINAPFNQKDYQWSLNQDGSLRELEQHLRVGKGKDKNRQAVDAEYDSKKKQTTIDVRQPKESKVVKEGLALLRLVTSKGGLNIEYQRITPRIANLWWTTQ